MAKSIFSIASSDKKVKEMMEECYYDLDQDNKVVRFISTSVATLNILLSGKANGGIPVGKMSMMSAPSMLGKSFVSMLIAKNAQRMGMNVAIIDTERAFSYSLASSLNIDISKDKLFVFQDNSIEKIINFILRICEGLTKEERENTLFIMDSWGSTVTSKTIEDGIEGKDVKDMTETQKKNKLANIMLNTRATHFIINHVYDNIGDQYNPLAIPGGRKAIFNSDCVLLGSTRSKETKEDADTKKKVVTGHVITVDNFKSRYAKEKTRLTFRINHDGGLDPFYGLLEDALAHGCVSSPSKGFYTRPFIDNDKKVRESQIYCSEFWKPIFTNTDFYMFVENKYKFSPNLDIVKEEADIIDLLG